MYSRLQHFKLNFCLANALLWFVPNIRENFFHVTYFWVYFVPLIYLLLNSTLLIPQIPRTALIANRMIGIIYILINLNGWRPTSYFTALCVWSRFARYRRIHCCTAGFVKIFSCVFQSDFSVCHNRICKNNSLKNDETPIVHDHYAITYGVKHESHRLYATNTFQRRISFF